MSDNLTDLIIGPSDILNDTFSVSFFATYFVVNALFKPYLLTH